MKSLRFTAACLVAGVIAAPMATAQVDWFQRDRYQSVTERPQPAYDPIPRRVGSFEADASLGVAAQYNSNVFASEDAEDDVIIVIDPSLNVRSDWSRHQVGASVVAQHREFLDVDSETSTDVRGTVYGRADLTRNWYVTSNAFASESFEPRTSVEAVPDVAERIEVNEFGGDITTRFTNGRVRLDGRFVGQRYDFDDGELISGGVFDQDFRDRVELGGEVRASYAVRRDLAVFAQGTYIDRNHDEPTIESPLNRDSENFEVEAGVDFELASLIRGDIAVGYLRTEFDDPALSAITGVSADAIFEWFVTQLTTVTLNATRQVDASGLVETAGRTTTVLGAQVDHELLRNVLLNARVEYTDFDFQDIDRQDDRIQLGAGALYKLNRRVQFTADYRYRDENSSGTDADIDFTEHLVMIGVRLFP